MADRIIAINDLAQGMQSDAKTPGTLREAVDILPWRGALRRRGPISAHGTLAKGVALPDLDTTPSIGRIPHPVTGEVALFASVGSDSGTAFAHDGSTWRVANTYGHNGRFVSVGDEVILLDDEYGQYTDQAYRWAGSSLPNTTGTGTVTVTAGSKIVTFGSAINSSVMDVGSYIRIPGAPSVEHYYLIDAIIDSNTATLRDEARASATPASGQWGILSTAPLQVSDSAASNGMFSQANAGAGMYANKVTLQNVAGGLAAASHQGRLFFGNIKEMEWGGTNATWKVKPARIRWSALPSEEDGNGFKGRYNFNNNAVLDLQEEGGAIMGLVSWGGALVVLRETAVQVVTGGFATTGVDLGASVNTVARGIGCSNLRAWQVFEDGIAFADANGCYLWDGERVNNLTRGVIEGAWRKLARSASGNIIVSTPGNRIVVSIGTNWFIYDVNHKSWFRMATQDSYSQIIEAGDSYIAVRATVFGTGAAEEMRSYDFKTVFEDLDTVASVRGLDADTDSLLFPQPYLLTNPVTLVDGFQLARIREVVLNDGGVFDETVQASVYLKRGALYSDDGYSGESDVADMTLGSYAVIPPILGAGLEPDVEQRSVKVRLDGVDEASHAMVLIRVLPSSAASRFSWGLNAIGLILEDNPNYQSA